MPVKNISIPVTHQGLFEFTQEVVSVVNETGVQEGLCVLFVQHTSASLIIQENADSSAKKDLERWLNRLVPEGDSLYTHRLEGADDMPAHIKSALTTTNLAIPIQNGQLALGTWQGIYLWEHRRHGGQRSIVIYVGNG
ncbi:secondary thiamine-phosphate synthase enzyme YjbQ [Candidatus Parabeggiatoa sp. HSG14]|uniref:secondary thiamine-phosphate synthase enzyme YjbQ n=1 Tax=Candidatus Parabeggiatoa sp. HSG14 TaxID=3055593 RepID=UPI0025A844EE|nr:secondary thiamine-phosphate synthase enzyme YjbQ [Thiotrichales bacterium HSG14]